MTEEYLQKASYLGTILPLLDIVYETVIEKAVKKYDLNIVKEFWIFFGLLVFAVIYYFDPLKIETIFFLAGATILTLILYNQDFFKRRLIPDDDSDIQVFLANIEEKNSQELIEFIRQYRNKLSEKDIIKIVESKHGKTHLIFNFILNYQKFPSTFLVYLMNANRFELLGESLIIKYIKKFEVGMDFNNYTLLLEHFKENDKIKKILILYNPNYSTTNSIFLVLSRFIQSFLISLKAGKLFDVIRIVTLIIVGLTAAIGYSQISSPYLSLEPYHSFPIFFFINYAFAFLITAAIIIFVLTIILDFIAKIFRSFVYHIIPL